MAFSSLHSSPPPHPSSITTSSWCRAPAYTSNRHGTFDPAAIEPAEPPRSRPTPRLNCPGTTGRNATLDASASTDAVDAGIAKLANTRNLTHIALHAAPMLRFISRQTQPLSSFRALSTPWLSRILFLGLVFARSELLRIPLYFGISTWAGLKFQVSPQDKSFKKQAVVE